MYCQFCGAAIDAGAKFCATCGRAQLPAEASAVTEPAAPPSAEEIPFSPPPPIAAIRSAQTSKWISEGWQLMSGELAQIVLASLLGAVVANVTVGILAGAFAIGMNILLTRKLLYGRVDLGDLFKGLKYWLDGLLATIVVAIFVFLGSLLCFIPGLIVAAMYMFTFHFIFDKRLGFWDAMQASHNVVKQDYFGYTIFLVAVALLNILGVLACFVGVLVTIPWGHAAVTVAYRDAVGYDPSTASLYG